MANLPPPNIEAEPQKGCLHKLIKLLLWGFGILLFFVVIGLLLEDPYPKSKAEMIQMLTNKCWKYDELEINSIVINGKTISKPSGNIRKKIIEAASGSNDRLIWERAQSTFNELTTDNYQFDCFKDYSNGKLVFYSQFNNKELGRPTYDIGLIDVYLKEDKYQFDVNDDRSEYTFEDAYVGPYLDGLLGDHIKIIGLSKDMLKMERSIKTLSNGDEVLISVTIKYKIVSETAVNTENLNRVLDGF